MLTQKKPLSWKTKRNVLSSLGVVGCRKESLPDVQHNVVPNASDRTCLRHLVLVLISNFLFFREELRSRGFVVFSKLVGLKISYKVCRGRGNAPDTWRK